MIKVITTVPANTIKVGLYDSFKSYVYCEKCNQHLKILNNNKKVIDIINESFFSIVPNQDVYNIELLINIYDETVRNINNTNLIFAKNCKIDIYIGGCICDYTIIHSIYFTDYKINKFNAMYFIQSEKYDLCLYNDIARKMTTL